jgi:hypothetical protein
MHFRLLPIAALALLLAPPAAACSMRWRPFNEDMAQRGANSLVVRARADIQVGPPEGEFVSGTVSLTSIRCLRKPHDMPCPRTLSIRFVHFNDGVNCPSPLLGVEPLRYFILDRDEDSSWSIARADRSRWTVRP